MAVISSFFHAHVTNPLKPIVSKLASIIGFSLMALVWLIAFGFAFLLGQVSLFLGFIAFIVVLFFCIAWIVGAECEYRELNSL